MLMKGKLLYIYIFQGKLLSEIKMNDVTSILHG